jgi:hypothetical protein
MSTCEYTILWCMCRLWHRVVVYFLLLLIVLYALYWLSQHRTNEETTKSTHMVPDVTCTLYDPAKLQQTLTLFANVPHRNHTETLSERHRTESMCRSLLETMLQMKLPKCRPKWLINPTTRRALELDMYNSENRIAFEYDGAQHDVYVPHYHHNEHHFAYRKLLDRLKTELCHEAGVLLIRIPWKDVSVNDQVRSARFLESLLYRNGLAYQSILG